jgi:hypothetical protein
MIEPKYTLNLDKETITILDELKHSVPTHSELMRRAVFLARYQQDLANDIKICSDLAKRKNPSSYLKKQNYHRLHRILRYVMSVSDNIKTSTVATQYPSGFLLRATLPPEKAEDLIGNFEHFYETVWRKKHYAWAAKMVFYSQSIRAILGHHAETLKGTLELYLKLKK